MAEKEVKEKMTPYAVISKRCRLPPHLKKHLPRHWERYGEVLVIKLPEVLLPYSSEIAEIYAEVLGVKTVLRDIGGISGRHRTPIFELIYGEEREAYHRENGVIYNFDPLRIMFSSGNIDERKYVWEYYRSLSGGDLVVWDLFAGIGYFSLQAARSDKVRKVVAVEINPVSYYYLIKNIIYNKLENKVVPILGDNRRVTLENNADSVIFGYFIEEEFPLYASIISKLLGSGGGTLHLHFLANREETDRRVSSMVRSLKACLTRKGLEIWKHTVRRVKSYAPLVYHYVLELDVVPGWEA